MEYFLNDAQPAVVVCWPQSQAMIEELARAAGTRYVFTLDDSGGGTLLQECRNVPAEFETAVVNAEDLAAILYTSGTTGRSKGAMLTHGNLASNARTLHEYWGFRADDMLLHTLPIFHIHGLFVAANVLLLNAGRMIFLPKFDAAQVIQYLSRATVFMGVPTYYTRLLTEPGFNVEACRNMRLFVSGSAPLLKGTFTGFHERTGHAILERYGMSETGMNTSSACRRTRRRHGRHAVAGRFGAGCRQQ